ncbi:MAG: class I SAM-dependent methyltransferase [Candidatus Melainabacteria bacterium]|nr:class I SAM-dependent methyltransferase [Candidatus Melainabacteria bacterium]
MATTFRFGIRTEQPTDGPKESTVGLDRQTLQAYEQDPGLFDRLDRFAITPHNQPLLFETFPARNPFGKQPSVLDVGCGAGTYTRWFLNRGYNAYGIDPWQSGIARAKSIYPALTERLQSGHLPCIEKPFHKDGFDWVFCSAVLMHLPNLPVLEAAAQNIRTLVKPGGKIYLSTSGEGRDLNADRRDKQGRFYLDLPPATLQKTFEQQGFSLIRQADNIDDRGIHWHSFIFQG